MILNRTSEEGSIILLVLMILMLISMFGLSSLNSSSSEMMISRNGRCYKQNVYRAEAAVMEVAQILETDTTPVTNLKPASAGRSWLIDGTALNPSFLPETGDWEFSGAGSNSMTSSLFGDTASGYSVVFEGLAPGGSYDMTSTQMWQYGAYGLAQLCDSQIGVAAGYRRRF